MRILITGVRGFTASHLIPWLMARAEGTLFLSDKETGSTENYFPCDLTEFSSVYDLICFVKPDQIYHLAGGYTNDFDNDYAANVKTTRNLLEALAESKLTSKILLIGSAAEYGNVAETDNPISEEYPLNPISHYGLTKVFQTLVMRYYASVRGVNVVMARTFNLIGEGQSRHLFYGNLLYQIQQYRQGRIQKILLGNLKHRRDFLEIEEAIRCYHLIMKSGLPGEVYNVARGRSTGVREVVDKIIKRNNLSPEIVEERFQEDRKKIDVKDIYADIVKLKNLKKGKEFSGLS
jgi:GDP-4-dehydro-6-deoxy-D-mannose reductase